MAPQKCRTAGEVKGLLGEEGARILKFLFFSLSDHSGISALENSEKQLAVSPKAKIRRTTSTPMTSNLHIKPGALDSLCGSSYQASSIEHSQDLLERQSPIVLNVISPSPAHQRRNEFAQRKSARQRFLSTNTPLRQVMSKSIQRALQAQGQGRFMPAQRKIAFSSLSSTSSDNDASLPALDLRTTPALKRSNSAPQRLRVAPSREESPPTDVQKENQLNEDTQNQPIDSATGYLSCVPENSTECTPLKLQESLKSDIWYTPLPLEPAKQEENYEPPEEKSPEKKPSLLCKFLRIPAGWIRKHTAPTPQKRRRIQSVTSPPEGLKSPIAKKYKMIHGRKPIQRMRNE